MNGQKVQKSLSTINVALLKDRSLLTLAPFTSLILTIQFTPILVMTAHFDQKCFIENASKIVVVGDGMAGKTALLTRFVHPDTFTREYSPTIFENQSHFIEVNNQQVRLYEINILNGSS